MKENQENRKLTKGEEKRQAAFEIRAAKLAAEGYRQTELVASSGRANIVGPLYGLILSVPFIVLFFVVNRSGAAFRSFSFSFTNYLLFILAMLAAIPVHELIHGLTFCVFTEGKFKSLAFGFNRQALAPYCNCSETLTKGQYLTGLLMPCLLLGVIPCIAAIAAQSFWLLLFGVVMNLSAGGDLLITTLLVPHKPAGKALYIDHPTKIGLTCFEKEGA